MININRGMNLSLQDIFGATHKINIIEFFLENPDMSYNIPELEEYLKMDRCVILRILNTLQYDGILVIEKIEHGSTYYKLARNNITSSLMSLVYAHSFYTADKPEVSDENKPEESL